MAYTTKRLSQVFKALANERRMNIIKFVYKKPLPVGEISKKLKLSLKSVSKHLQKMEREGLVEKHHEGKFVYYQITGSTRKSGVTRQIIESI